MKPSGLSRYALKRKLRRLQDDACDAHKVPTSDLDRLFRETIARRAAQNGGARPQGRTEELAAYVTWLQDWLDGHQKRASECRIQEHAP